MSSDDGLRTLIFDRINVAADEILRVFQQKMEGSEAELEHQRRRVESVWREEAEEAGEGGSSCGGNRAERLFG